MVQSHRSAVPPWCHHGMALPPHPSPLSLSFPPPQIKRFLKEDSEEAELTQFLRDCPPADSPRKVEPLEGRRDPSHPLCGRAPGEEPANEHDVRSFSHTRPLDSQQLIMAPPPPSPSRPRSPWGQLDPYDSSEVRWAPGKQGW